ncbi:MAG: enoyl-CoA hydratase, partial [Acidimicrobiia bacterium]
MSDVILTDVADGIAVVTLNRPDARNALNTELRRAVPRTLRELDAHPDVRVMVLTGADPAFCAGLDLKELGTSGLSADPDATPLPFGSLTKPLIGAINGAAVTGGFELALGCDLLVASERARFADTHARVGVMPGWGLTVLLPQAIGIRRARQMSFPGNSVDASTALAWGLVNEVVPHDGLLDRARELAADMVSVPETGLAAIKAAYRAASAPVDDPALAAEAQYSREWSRSSFDAGALAANREAIQARGRAQQG